MRFELKNRESCRFTSKELDEETGLYYYGARYYEPTSSRWMSADPAGFGLVNPMGSDGKPRAGYSVIESLNWYSYVSNNPVRYVDPTGMEEVYPGYSWTSARRAGRLSTSQDTVRNAPEYKMEGGGPLKLADVPSGTTWCNQATFAVGEKMGATLDDGYNKNEKGEPDPLITTANDFMSNLSVGGNSMEEVGPEEAQSLADEGYVVIAGWENPSGGSGHLATVRPNREYTEENGPMVSNVGNENVIGTTREYFAVDAVGYGATSMDDIRYYYDPNQKFED